MWLALVIFLWLPQSPKTWLTSLQKPPYPTQPCTSTWLLFRQTWVTGSLLCQRPSAYALIFSCQGQSHETLARCTSPSFSVNPL